MNRTIKFRAWDKASKRYIDPEYLYTNSKGEIVTVVDNYENHYSLLDDVILMQFTGLTDKNGKEIFCGDVVKRTTFTRDGEEQMTSIGEVVYKAPSFGMKLAEYKDWVEPLTDGEFQETGYDGMGTEVDFKYEVIGNIFEDNNLLKESK
jgi:uncharacterized phage protein (TIGR01671 family)